MSDSSDIEAEVTFLTPQQGGRSVAPVSGYRPHHRIKADCDTTGRHTYLSSMVVGQPVLTAIAFLSPEIYPHSLRIGQTIEVREGSHLVGHAKVVRILNPLLDASENERPGVFNYGASETLSDWERLLAAERHIQYLIPEAVLVGGTAVGLHLRHRQSLDGDHVVAQLKGHFEEVLTTLEAAAGWRTERVVKPVLILGSLDGMPTGIRQLRRTQPLETEVIDGLKVPTLAEMARIKAWLLATRHTVRDYLDTVALFERLQIDGVKQALQALDSLYAQPTGASVLSEVAERLAAASPADLASVDLHSYRGLSAPWNDWAHLKTRGAEWATVIARLALGNP